MPKVYVKNPKELEEKIIKNGFSQSSLSLKIGKERSLVHVVLKRGSCSPSTAKQICEILKVGFDDIFLLKASTNVNNKSA